MVRELGSEKWKNRGDGGKTRGRMEQDGVCGELDLVGHDEVLVRGELGWMLVNGVRAEADVAEGSGESFGWDDTRLLEDGEDAIHFCKNKLLECKKNFFFEKT